MVVKVLTYNCQGLSSVEKRLDVFNHLKSKQCHIYCLQDIHSTTSNENYIRLQWGSGCIYSSGTSNSRGVAILFSKNVEYKVHNKITDFFFFFIHVSTLYFKYSILPMRASRNSTRKKGSTFLEWYWHKIIFSVICIDCDIYDLQN